MFVASWQFGMLTTQPKVQLLYYSHLGRGSPEFNLLLDKIRRGPQFGFCNKRDQILKMQGQRFENPDKGIQGELKKKNPHISHKTSASHSLTT